MMANNCGVYQIKNIITGDYYIGSSSILRKRLNNHRSALSRNCHENTRLQRAWNKYGEQAFEFTIILLCGIKHKLYFEQGFLDLFKPTYNMSVCATAVMQGRHHNTEAKRKIGAARKGELNPMFGRRLNGELNHRFGKHCSEETKRKIGEANTGRHPSEETRRKLSEATTGERNPNFGKRHTKETCAKMSAALNGKHLGKHHTEETKRKISEAQRRRWEYQKACAV